MNQTLENGKKTNFGTNFGLFNPKLGPNFFCGFHLYHELDIVPRYHPMQFNRNQMNQN